MPSSYYSGRSWIPNKRIRVSYWVSSLEIVLVNWNPFLIFTNPFPDLVLKNNLLTFCLAPSFYHNGRSLATNKRVSLVLGFKSEDCVGEFKPRSVSTLLPKIIIDFYPRENS